jgi:hypothetical protein
MSSVTHISDNAAHPIQNIRQCQTYAAIILRAAVFSIFRHKYERGVMPWAPQVIH